MPSQGLSWGKGVYVAADNAVVCVCLTRDVALDCKSLTVTGIGG